MKPHPDPLVLERPELPPEVEAHLAACADCRIDRRLLRDLDSSHEPTPELPSALPDPVSLVATWRSSRAGSLYGLPDDVADEEESLPSPADLGPYAVDARLGRGGMAVVYRVVDRRTGEHRALKVLRRTDHELRRRLAREGRVQAELKAPNVVGVVETLDLEGSPALVLEYVPGPSLQQVLRDEPLPLDVVDRVAAEILTGMAAAHAQGIVHRDLKPGNVLLEPTDDGFVARVTDFGLARATQATDSLHTRTGAFAGTPLYMAPEQLRDASRADARSDVFSLGALLYELATGLRCFAGVDYVDIVRRVADVSWTPTEHVRADVPDRMRDAIASALQVDPGDRPPDAAALLALWAPETPDAPWPAPRVAAGVVLHDPQVLEVSDEPTNNLKPAEDTFIGRDATRERVAKLLSEERLVTLTGPGGVGKTRLATEVARQLAHAFPGGVWFCDLVAARSLDGIAAAVAKALDLPLEGDPVQQVGSALAGRGEVLVVLDNFEQVVEHAEACVEPWLEGAPEARFLVTSREPLDLFDECLQPLDILDDSEAVALFVSRARRAVPDFSVSETNREAIGRIVARLDALPLAIEIVAARVRSHDLARILKHLDRFSGDRHATLRQTLDGSWDLLSSHERAALTRLTVFETPCTPEALADVLGDCASAVDDLLRRSLARRVDGRVRLLVPIRQWAGGKLSDDARRDAEVAHGTHFASLPLDSADDQLDDMLAATDRALDRGDLATADGAGTNAHGVLTRTGPMRRVLHLVDRVLGSEACTELTRGQWLLRRGRTAYHTGDSSKGIAELEEAVAIGAAHYDQGLQADAYNWLGNVYMDFDTDRARACLHQALEISERHGFEQRIAFLNGALGALAKRCDDVDTSRRHYERSLAEHRRLGNERGIAMVLGDLGVIDLRQGLAERAEERILEAIEILARHNNLPGEAVGWTELAEVYSATARPDQAREALLRCRALNRDAGSRRAELAAIWALGELELGQGEDVAAGTWMEEGLSIARDVGDRYLVGTALRNVAGVRAAQGSTQLAERLDAQGRELLENL